MVSTQPMSAGPDAPSTPVEPTDPARLDAAVGDLVAAAPSWCAQSPAERLVLVDELRRTVHEAAPAWATAAARAKGIASDSTRMGEDWVSGPLAVQAYLLAMRSTLRDIARTGRPQPPRVKTREDGRVVVQVVPGGLDDRMAAPGAVGEVQLADGVDEETALADMGRIYRPEHVPAPAVALVLGAGNVSSIAPTDVLTQLFSNDRVVLLKMNPVNEHLGPHLAEALEPLVARGWLRIVYGGAEVGQRAVDHPDVDLVHLTGSDATHDAIVFGPGEQGAQRKARAEPRLAKEVTAELGNVTPVIVVPGPWSEADLARQGRLIARSLTNNAGFNCVTSRILVTHRAWAKRRPLLDRVRDTLAATEPREPYYPGARQRWERFASAYPQAETLGPADDEALPFTLIPELDPDSGDERILTTEAFCPVMAEVPLDAPRSTADFLDEAVTLCNERLWGTLAATILVHPASLRDPETARALERAIDRLDYGVVVVNDWPGIAFGMARLPWGAAPGSEPTDIRSGRGFVHNTYLLEHVHKSVLRAPWRPAAMPVWNSEHPRLARLAPQAERLLATGAPGAVVRAMAGMRRP